MLKKAACFAIISANLIFNSTALAGLEAANISIRNTIQAPFTDGSEAPVGDPQSATVSSVTTEFPVFIDLYDVDISDNSIAFQWVDTQFSQSIEGPVGADVFDRNYFVFNLPNNEVITDISFDPAASNLLPGSALPSAQIVSPNEVLTIFGEGVIREAGFNPVFRITTAVPVPNSIPTMSTMLLLLTSLGLGIMGFYSRKKHL